MLSLTWQWEDGKQGNCVGTEESLLTVKFAIKRQWPNIKFALKDVVSGRDVCRFWLEDSERINENNY